MRLKSLPQCWVSCTAHLPGSMSGMRHPSYSWHAVVSLSPRTNSSTRLPWPRTEGRWTIIIKADIVELITVNERIATDICKPGISWRRLIVLYVNQSKRTLLTFYTKIIVISSSPESIAVDVFQVRVSDLRWSKLATTIYNLCFKLLLKNQSRSRTRNKNRHTKFIYHKS